MLAQKTHNCTTGFPVSLLDFPSEESEGGFSRSRLDLAKESYKYMIYPNRKTHEQFTWSPYYIDSSKPLRISKEDIDRLQKVLAVYMELPEKQLAVVEFAEDVCDMPYEVFCEIETLGLTNQIYKARRIIRETCRTLNADKVSISTDPEIPERKRIRITLTVSGTPKEVFADEVRFKEWMYSNLDIKVCELITITYEWEK